MVKQVEVIYHENIDLTWDSCTPGLLVVAKDTKSLAHAKVITELMLEEEYGEFKIIRETIHYY